jgi:undecaprenyl-diphosphatase
MYLPISFLSVILGIVEGLTEFIPVSSTGHLILTDHFLNFQQAIGGAERAELFEVVIQLGAILAVGFLYRNDLTRALLTRRSNSPSWRLRTHLFAAFLPAAILGLLFHKQIKEYLFSPASVAISLIAGGVLILFIEKMQKGKQHTTELYTMKMRDALIVGFSQVLSLIPGVSRSGATIMSGFAGGMTRSAATEFSFLLSFPVMIAASGYELLKYREYMTSDTYATLGIGFVVSFFSALIVVRWLIGFVRRHSFVGFGVYRIIFGILVLLILK